MNEESRFDTPSAPAGDKSIAKKIHTEEAILITLMALSAVGIGATNFKPAESFWYWVSMAPVFGAVSIYIGWSKARRRGEGVSRILWVQLLHWVGLLAAIALIYFLFRRTGRIDYNQLALMSLLVLSLTTFLAGVHFDWRFMVVGIVLGLCVAGAAFVEQVLWMVAIPVVAALVLIVFWWKRSV
ncbi:MAG TPA: hypothetical protein VHC46_02240 [Thermodesulfobacteriota bacterium]|nr:hypothetical protein [Thermodesulfobacteriota bacterium]